MENSNYINSQPGTNTSMMSLDLSLPMNWTPTPPRSEFPDSILPLDADPSTWCSSTPAIPDNLTQAMVDADPALKRFQQDLLILTSFNENETLHWRPSWFKQGRFSEHFWTLYNPPNVVTMRLPSDNSSDRQVYTRRMISPSDPAAPAPYVTTWQHWHHICNLRGIPHDFLCEEQIALMTLGLPRDVNGYLRAPPTYPLYPEPQPLGRGRYILETTTYATHLPAKFHSVRTDARDVLDRRVVVVHSSGALAVEPRFDMFMHASQWTLFDGTGAYCADELGIPDLDVSRVQGKGRKWSYLPWTNRMAESCVLGEEPDDGMGLVLRPKMGAERCPETELTIRLRGWNERA